MPLLSVFGCLAAEGRYALSRKGDGRLPSRTQARWRGLSAALGGTFLKGTGATESEVG